MFKNKPTDINVVLIKLFVNKFVTLVRLHKVVSM